MDDSEYNSLTARVERDIVLSKNNKALMRELLEKVAVVSETLAVLATSVQTILVCLSLISICFAC